MRSSRQEKQKAQIVHKLDNLGLDPLRNSNTKYKHIHPLVLGRREINTLESKLSFSTCVFNLVVDILGYCNLVDLPADVQML